jgi:hypothetical protein
MPTFEQVAELCLDINSGYYVDRAVYSLRELKGFEKIPRPPDFTAPGYLCTSEQNSENVEHVCKHFKWKPLYYFFHGWAALDWYRGYDRTFLITPPKKKVMLQEITMVLLLAYRRRIVKLGLASKQEN